MSPLQLRPNANDVSDNTSPSPLDPTTELPAPPKAPLRQTQDARTEGPLRTPQDPWDSHYRWNIRVYRNNPSEQID